MPKPAPTHPPASAPASPTPGNPRGFECPQCGAAMAFDPGRCALACASCGHARLLPPPTPDAQARALEEQDYDEALRRLAAREPSLQAHVVDCPSCGALTRFDGHVVGDLCAFCASPLLVEQAHAEQLIQPQALLPFALDRQAAQQVFSGWVGSRWFAPNALKRSVSRADGVRGVYLPWWTYDARTVTTYRGERGVQRQVADSPRGSSGAGGQGSRTVTDWTPATGAVQVAFDDILVVGSPSIPAHLARVLNDWNLAALRPPEPDLLAGFGVEVYRHGLEQGFGEARSRMDGAIDAAIRRDIGGNEQRIHGRSTVVDDIRFKHLLLPVWIGSYRFSDKPYRVVVNGQSGEVEGDRPYSAVKIGLAVLLVAVLLLMSWWQSN